MSWDRPVIEDWFNWLSSIGEYTIIPILKKKKFLLRLDGRAIGILSNLTEIRRLAETDYKQRIGAIEDHG